jgi:toxin ParE1/3/4
MTRKVIVQPQSELDIEAATLWYEGQVPGLGSRFLAELNRVFLRIEENPLQFPQLENAVRRALLRQFPYGVYFLVDSEHIPILAVLHLHRQPSMWKDRT